MGDVGGDDLKATFAGFHFRGQRIVKAMITYLMQNEGLCKNPGDLVVFSCGSAGARGAMVNLDTVADMLTPKGLKVIGLLDSPLWMDLDTINKTELSLSQQMELAYKSFNVTGIVP